MSVHAAPSVEIIRCYRDGETYSEMHPYRGCAQLTYMHPGAAMVTGMHGKWSRSDLVDLMQHVHGHGVGWLLAERSPGHGLPWGEIVDGAGWPGDGMWRINLAELFGPVEGGRADAGGGYGAGAVGDCHAGVAVPFAAECQPDCVKER